MNVPADKYPRRWRDLAITCIAMLLVAQAALAQDDVPLPPIGGPGGNAFSARCPQGELLTGLDLWAGEDIDAARPICVPAVAGQFQTFPYKYGGTGGSLVQVVCPNHAPFVYGFDIGAEGKELLSVNDITLFCGVSAAGKQSYATFHAPFARKNGTLGTPVHSISLRESCPSDRVAVGINGRAGIYLDAVGLICGSPMQSGADPRDVVQASARVKSSEPNATQRPICEVAAEARARNSPTAYTLEEQCRKTPPADLDALAARGAKIAARDPLAAELRSQQPEGPARHGFDIGMGAADGQTSAGPGKQKIHDFLRGAEREGFATAVSFSLARNRGTISDLATSGSSLADQDPLAALLRSQQPSAAAQRGFDVGMAAAKGQTEPGPGKQRIHDGLPQAEQAGFTAAVDFTLLRNRYASYAAKGAYIVQRDRRIGTARNASSNAFYRLGFDIATGMRDDRKLSFGDLVKVRDSLNGQARNGFDAAL